MKKLIVGLALALALMPVAAHADQLNDRSALQSEFDNLNTQNAGLNVGIDSMTYLATMTSADGSDVVNVYTVNVHTDSAKYELLVDCETVDAATPHCGVDNSVLMSQLQVTVSADNAPTSGDSNGQ